MPLELLDLSIGSRVLVLMKTEKEVEGVLLGFDEFVNMVMTDVTEYVVDTVTGEKREVKLEQALVNGNNVAMLCPLKDK